jgi:hypothetical protein
MREPSSERGEKTKEADGGVTDQATHAASTTSPFNLFETF